MSVTAAGPSVNPRSVQTTPAASALTGAEPSHTSSLHRTDSDTATARAARYIDAVLGGKDNFPEDRETLRQLRAVAPVWQSVVMQEYGFVTRVVRHLLKRQRPITRFIDCSVGFPRPDGNDTHNVVLESGSDAAVLYVASDKVITAHINALMLDTGQITISNADPLSATSIAANLTISDFVADESPCAVLYPSSLQYAPDPRTIIRAWINRLPPGSYLVLTHPCRPAEPSPLTTTATHLEKILSSRVALTSFRTIQQINDLFAGTEFVKPGLIAPDKWWPPGPATPERDPVHDLIVAGVAHTCDQRRRR